MLTIRSPQLQAFEEARKADLSRRVAAHLRERHPEDVHHSSDAQLVEAVAEGLERGRALGMTWESTLAAFVCLTFTIAPRFYEHPAVKAILEDPRIAPNLLIDVLLSQLSDEEWDQASRLRRDE